VVVVVFVVEFQVVVEVVVEIEVEVGVEVEVVVEVEVLTSMEVIMDINSMTVGEVKAIAQMFGGGQMPKSHSFVIGKKYLIRTVTFYTLGKLESVTDTDLMLSSASWAADTGLFSEALATGKLNEVEPYPNECIVSRGAIVDASEWMHDLPRQRK
jgi:hypothetical protein